MSTKEPDHEQLELPLQFGKGRTRVIMPYTSLCQHCGCVHMTKDEAKECREQSMHGM